MDKVKRKITEWNQVIALTAIIIALLTWIKMDMITFQTEIRGWKAEIDKEMKDFHGRLCAIESARKEK